MRVHLSILKKVIKETWWFVKEGKANFWFENWSGMGLLADNVEKVRGQSMCLRNLSTAGWDMERMI